MADACAKCEREIGVDKGYAPIDGLCAPCSPRPARKCKRCEVVFADVGISGCPFCGFALVS